MVDKPVDVTGAGQGQTIVLPALSGANPGGGGSLVPGGSNVFLVQADNVVIDNLTVDGDNPSLTSGIVVNGADLDARNGIITNHNLGTFNNLYVHDVTVKDIYLRGIYASSGGTFHFAYNTVDNVAADPSSIAIFNFLGSGIIDHNTVTRANDAISANHSRGTQFLDNVISQSGSGVHTDNAGDSGGTTDLIQGNTVQNGSLGAYGIFVFVPYNTVTVDSNIVSNVDVGLAAFGGQGGSAAFSNNTVTVNPGGTGAFVTTDTLGFGQMNVSATFNGDSFTGYSGGGTGISVVQNAGATATVGISGVTINDPTIGIDVSGGSVSITGNHIYNNDIGIELRNAAVATAITGNNFVGGTANATDLTILDTSTVSSALTGNTFDGSTFFIDEQSIGQATLTALSTLFGGTNTYAGASTGFDIERKIHHAVDTDISASVGLVGFDANNVFITGGALATDHSIQRGIDVASNGNIVNVETGTYSNQNVVVNKSVTVLGQGSGAGGSVISITSGNGFEIAADNVLLQSLRVAGTGSTNGIYINSTVNGDTLTDVVATGNGTGLEVHNSAVVTNLQLNQVSLINGTTGFRVATQGTVNGLQIDQSHFDSNTYGFYTNANSASTTNQNGFNNITITNSSFDNDLTKGIYVEKLNNALLDHITANNSGTGGASPAGIDINLKYGTYSNITISNATLIGSGTGTRSGHGLTIKGRNDAPSYNSNPASLSGVHLTNVTISGSPIDLDFENNVTGITLSGVQLLGSGLGLFYGVTAVAPLALADTSFDGVLAFYIGNASANPIDATAGATFGGFNSGAGSLPADLATYFAIEDKIVDAIDVSGLGLVRLLAGNVFVTPLSYYVPGGTSTPSIQRGVDAATASDTVNVQAGTFVDNITVPKSLTITGAGQGNTILLPATSAATLGSSSLDGVVILIDANNVTIQGLTIDGNNNVNTGIITDWNQPVSYTGMTVKNVTVQNVYLRGIEYADGNDNGTGTADLENDTVTNVQGDSSSSISIFSYGGSGTIANNTVNQAIDAISTNWSFGTAIFGNVITNSGTGIHSDNNGGFLGGSAADSIHDNNVSLGTGAGSSGIFVFVPYLNVNVQNNTVSGVGTGLAAFGGQGGSAAFSNNTVTVNPGGTGAFVTTDTLGFGQMNVSATFNGDSFTGYSGGGTGISVVQNAGATATVGISGVTINDPTIGIDVSGGSVSITGNHIYNNDIGIQLRNAAVATAITGNNFVGGTANATDLTILDTSTVSSALTGNTFDGSTFFIDEQSIGQATLTALSTLFGGTNTYAGASTGFDIERKIHHAVDTDLSASVGLVVFDANNVFITGGALATDHSIQRGIDVASNGNIVNVETGTYSNQNVVVNKSVTVLGQGSGAGGSVISITSGNGFEIAADNVLLQSLRVAGTGSTNGIYINSTVNGDTLTDVVATGNGTGLEVHNSAVVTNLQLNQVSLINGTTGFRVATQGTVNGLQIDQSHFDSNTYGFYTNANSASTTNQNGFNNITITNSSFDNDLTKGIYVEKLNNALLDHITANNSGTGGASPAGIDINLKYGTYSNITISNATLIGSGTGSASGHGLTIKGRNDAPSYNSNPASLSGVHLTNVTISGSPIDLDFENNVTGITLSGVQLLGSGLGLFYGVTAVAPLALADTSFDGVLAFYIGNASANPIDATAGATFGGFNSGAGSLPADLATYFAIEDKIVNAIDVSGLGLVRLLAGNVFVTPLSYYVPGGTSTPSIQRGVDAADPTNTVNVENGTYVGQVTIGKDLTLRGQGPATIIQAPASLVTQFTTSGPNKPVVYFTGTNAGNIDHVEIDGAGQGNSNNRIVGLAYNNAAGTVNHVTITGVRDTPLDGVQAGVGILAFTNDSGPRTLNVTNNTISDYQKNGMVLAGVGLTVNVTGNTVTGAGPTALIARERNPKSLTPSLTLAATSSAATSTAAPAAVLTSSTTCSPVAF